MHIYKGEIHNYPDQTRLPVAAPVLSAGIADAPPLPEAALTCTRPRETPDQRKREIK